MATRNLVNNPPALPPVATPADLWNVSGSANQSGAVEAGDTCYVTGDALLYVCTDPTPGAGAWSAVGASTGQTVLFEWNGVDDSQFTKSGDPNWSTSVDNLGPNGVPRLVFTALSASGDKNAYWAVTDLIGNLPQQYTVFYKMGPYSGNAVPTQRVRPAVVPIFLNDTRFLSVGAQGDNVGGNNSQNLEFTHTNGGGPSYGAVNNVLPWSLHPKGLYKVHMNVEGTFISGGVEVYGGKGRIQNDFGVSVAGGTVGIFVSHFGTGMAIGDSGYMYGLKVVRGLV